MLIIIKDDELSKRFHALLLFSLYDIPEKAKLSQWRTDQWVEVFGGWGKCFTTKGFFFGEG